MIRSTSFFVCLFFFCLLFQQASAQQAQTGNLQGKIYGIIDQLPGADNDDYSDPTPMEFFLWKTMIQTLLDEDYTQASILASDFNYRLIELNDAGENWYILERDTNGGYWGTYVYNPNYCRNVVIQATHPKKDFNTGKQGIYVLKATNSRFYCLSGTNRCNHSAVSECSGTTSICDATSSPFRISDVAHNDSCIFQATTETIHDLDTSAVFIQFHGFSKQSTDPYVIMSNGTQVTPSPDYIDQLATALETIDDTLDFKIAHQDLNWTRLRGFTNTQGRYINQSADVCDLDATNSLGKFIHLEQEKSRLRQDSTKWDKMVFAIEQVFECPATGIDELHTKDIQLFPNPSAGSVHVSLPQVAEEIFDVEILNADGRVLMHLKNQTSDCTISREQFDAGTYFIRVHSPSGDHFVKRFVFL